MRKFTLSTFCALLVLWGISYWLNKKIERDNPPSSPTTKNETPKEVNESILTTKNIRQLNRLGEVVNEENVVLNEESKKMIQEDKIVFDRKRDLKQKQNILEQSFKDPHSDIKDIKRIQDNIVELKLKLNKQIQNTERWNPLFVYYLLIEENYNFDEINAIKSLAENGISAEEVNYINDLIKEKNFLEKVKAFKGLPTASRSLAALKRGPKERDEFIDEVNTVKSLESKLIEMDYSPEEKEEIIYGHNIQ